MNTIMLFLAKWFPLMFQVVGFFCLTVFILGPKFKRDLVFNHKILFLVVLIISVIQPIYLTALQYYVWAGDQVSRILLSQPVVSSVPYESIINYFGKIFGNSGYFIFYSFGRFWLANLITWFFVLLAIGSSYLINKYYFKFPTLREIFYLATGFLLVGWPKLLVFVVLMLLIALLIAFYDKFRGINNHVSISVPVIVSLFITIVFQGYYFNLIGLQSLAV